MNNSPSKIKHRMFFIRLLVMVLIPIGFTVSATTKEFEDSTHVEYPEWFVDGPFLDFDLAEVNEEALAKGKKGTMVLFTTRGCSYCEQFIRRSLGDPKIAKLVQEKFDSIGMEIFDDAEMVGPAGETMAVKHFAKKEGAGFAPTLLFYDENGKRVLRQIGYQAPQRFLHLMDYVADDHYQSQSLRDFLATKLPKEPAKNTYTSLKADALFDEPPYALDRSRFAASDPLLVLFEKPGCTECESFHQDVMTLKDVRGTLKQFQVVRLNSMDNKTRVLAPDGKQITPSQWYQQAEFTQLPALLFFNEAGKQVLKTDAFVRHHRVMNTPNYVLEKAYKKGWTYQQFARSKGIERSLQQAK
jgi:thioredoxin-related protein